MDFARDPRGIEDAVNSWVAEKTNNKIQKLLSGNVTRYTDLILLNAVYFQGWLDVWRIIPSLAVSENDGIFAGNLKNEIGFSAAWVLKFKPCQWYRRIQFELRGGKKVDKTFMQRESKFFHYHSTDKLDMVAVPYKGKKFHLLVAIPKDRSELIGSSNLSNKLMIQHRCP